MPGGVGRQVGAGGPLTVWHAAGAGTTPIATPRLNGLLGGVGLNLVRRRAAGVGSAVAGHGSGSGLARRVVNLGSATAWTVFLVWSRPNWRQKFRRRQHAAQHRRHAGSGRRQSMAASGLVLVSRAQQTVLTSSLTRRHSHAVILRNTPGVASMSGWMRRRSRRPLPTRWPRRSLRLCCSCTAARLGGGSECWFHEAAFWRSALTATGIAAVAGLSGAMGPWGRAEASRSLSPASPMPATALNDGAWHLLAQGVAWHLGRTRLWRRRILWHPAGRRDLYPWRRHLSGAGAGPHRLVPQQPERRQ